MTIRELTDEERQALWEAWNGPTVPVEWNAVSTCDDYLPEGKNMMIIKNENADRETLAVTVGSQVFEVKPGKTVSVQLSGDTMMAPAVQCPVCSLVYTPPNLECPNCG